jgi:hypothetical protein
MLQKIKTDYIDWDAPVSSNVSFDGTVNLGSTYVENVGALTIVSGNVTINLSEASAFTLNLTSDINNIEVVNYPQSSGLISFVMIVTGDGTVRSITWPESFKWPDSLDPVVTATLGKKDIFCFFTLDNGINWQSIISGQNL